MKYYIYALIDPRFPSRYHYIGCSAHVTNRLARHCACGETIKMRKWIKELQLSHLQPSLVILQTVNDKERALEAEQKWIKNCKSSLLINTTITGASHRKRSERKQTVRLADKLMLPVILKTLKETNGNKHQTAKIMGIGRQTLYNKLRRWEANKDQFQNLDT